MGIFGSFKRANQVIEDSKKDIARGRKARPRDEVKDQRKQGKQGGKR